MPAWFEVALGSLIAVVVQALSGALSLVRERRELRATVCGAARLIRDDVTGGLEAIYYTLTTGEWWPAALDTELTATHDDRRLLATRADGNTLRRTFGSLRRYGQLRRLRNGRGGADAVLSRADHIEAIAVFLDLAEARRRLAKLTGYGTAPYHRPLRLPEDLLVEALPLASLETADGLYLPEEAVSRTG